MRYYSNSATSVTTVRKTGHYCSTRVASFLAKRFAYLFENEQYTSMIALYLAGDQQGWEMCVTHLTPAEYSIVDSFGCWWACEDIAGEVPVFEKAFVACNLNAGRTLVISGRM